MRRLPIAGKLGLLAVCMALLYAVAWQFGAIAGGVLLVVSIYLTAAFYSGFVADLGDVRRGMDQAAAGDLHVALAKHGRDEVAAMTDALKAMIASLSAMVASVRSNSALVAHAGQSLARSNRDLSDRTEQQAANLEQTAASVEQLSDTVHDNARTLAASSERADKVRDVADRGAQVMGAAVKSVEAIQNNATRMDEIVGVIDSLAFQTNILALNAAVEAARAGEAGRGFAVVASEVRALAQRSADSAREIRQLIGSSSSQVQSSVAQIRDAGDSMSEIVSGFHDVAGSMARSSASSADQSLTLSEVSTAIRHLDEITQNNARMVEYAVVQAADLEQRAATLAEAVEAFNLQQGTADEALALVGRAVAWRERVDRDRFLSGLTEPTQGFHDRDMYVFALDRQGHYLAFGGNPAKVGTRVQDIPGVDGEKLMRAIVAQAEREPGWVEYDITNPSTGTVQTKMSYVQRVDDLYVGCGVYKNLVAH